jgi:hypothetical protein
MSATETKDGSPARRRAERLLRWYPKSWRARYGEEFVELLAAEFSERPRSQRRGANVAWSGIVARLTDVGLTSHTLEPSRQIRASLASLGCALAVFVALGAAMWSQLTVGWQWARPDTIGTRAAMLVMSAALLLYLVLGALAAIPLAVVIVGRMAQRRAPGLVRPTFLFLMGSAFLVVGARHFGNGWPGTGGHHWAHQGLVPGGAAAFLWASTLSISSYWVHPGALLAFPTLEVAWMVISPLAMVCVVTGASKIVRRLDTSARLLQYERRLGKVAAYATGVFMVGSCCWIVDGGPGPRDLFHAGAIDVAALAAMVTASLVALRALQRAHSVGLNAVTH